MKRFTKRNPVHQITLQGNTFLLNQYDYARNERGYPAVDSDEILNKLGELEDLLEHIVEIDNNQDNGDDYYFIAFEKTKEVRELLEMLKEVIC